MFPEWLYDADRLNDFVSLLNLEMLNTSLRQLAVDLKLGASVTTADGYRNELDEAKWKPFKPGKERLQARLRRHAATRPGTPRLNRGAIEHSFPALRLLEEALASLPTGTKLIVVMMPPHISAQPDTAAERADLDLCKQRIAALATSRSGYTIDFDIASAWTRNADNYWDASHFRTASPRTSYVA